MACLLEFGQADAPWHDFDGNIMELGGRGSMA